MILVVGEALVDVVERADSSRTSLPGGSPANVAVGLGRLGLDVCLASSLGNDEHGSMIERHLSESGVTLSTGSRGQSPTSTALARLATDGSAGYEFDVTWNPDSIDSTGDVTAVHAGSIGATLEPGANVVETLVRRLAPLAIVSFDPNIRPMLLPDHTAVVHRVDRFVALADLVKVSDEDLAWLYPGESTQTVAYRWLASGPAIVVVTKGAGGSTARARSGTLRVPAARTDVVDTVGAGDAYTAGLLAALEREELLSESRRDALHGIDLVTLDRVATTAARAAAIVVGREGAQPPTRAELWPDD